MKEIYSHSASSQGAGHLEEETHEPTTKNKNIYCIATSIHKGNGIEAYVLVLH